MFLFLWLVIMPEYHLSPENHFFLGQTNISHFFHELLQLILLFNGQTIEFHARKIRICLWETKDLRNKPSKLRQTKSNS